MTTRQTAVAVVAATAAVLAMVATAHPPPSSPPEGVYPTDPAAALAYDTYAYPVGWTPPPLASPPPHVSVCDWEEHQPDDTLYWRLTGGRTIGGCAITPSTTGACSLYAKSAVGGATGDRGHPKSRDNRGTGCVGNDAFCYYRSQEEYDLTDGERGDMCTTNMRHNAVAQLRHAMRNGACGGCEREGW